jgi:hypothetical protein
MEAAGLGCTKSAFDEVGRSSVGPMQFASTQMIDGLLQTKRHIYIPSQHTLSSVIYNCGAKVLRLFHTINTVICRSSTKLAESDEPRTRGVDPARRADVQQA